VAHASVVYYDCSVVAAANELVTGSSDTYSGVMFGVAVFDDADSHTLRCYIRINGGEAASTPKESGTVAVRTLGLVTFTVPPDSFVEICTEIDAVTVSCSSVEISQIPPQEVEDLLTTLEDVVTTVEQTLPESLTNFIDNIKPGIVDPTLCPVLASLAPGAPGVDISPEGDTTIVGDPVWDCPPYGNLGPTRIPPSYVYVMTGSDHS
jgi:hypothetical protein